MTSNSAILISISIALLAGLMLSRLAKKASLPAVTAYLIAGVFIGPFVLGGIGINGLGISHEQVAGLSIISDIALGFIAFSMGNEFRLTQLKKIGKQAMVIGVWCIGYMIDIIRRGLTYPIERWCIKSYEKLKVKYM